MSITYVLWQMVLYKWWRRDCRSHSLMAGAFGGRVPMLADTRKSVATSLPFRLAVRYNASPCSPAKRHSE